MKFSYNWIRELVDGLEAAPQELGRLITMKTAECEGVEEVGVHLASVCAARVISVEPLPPGRGSAPAPSRDREGAVATHNVKAVVETGRYGTKTVVCGAPNCRAGMVTAYVPAGVRLGGREIGKATISGVESDGMLASGAELGINRDAAGVLELNAEPGEPIPGCRPDSIIEIDNKSITHRPDLWGHFGLAREAAAILRQPLRDPAPVEPFPSEPAPISIAIEDLDLCPRYSALVFENVSVRPSPPWLQYRLESIGLNPINNVVDVTNFVMSELAQPMHAFDQGLLHGGTIFIRPARQGERLLALNEETYDLGPTNLVIADAQGPIALAGVIGGLDSAINENTTRIVLESACFQASSIRKTSARLKLRTDASMRFEKAQDPANTVRGLARAVDLLREVSPGIRIAGGLADQRKPAAPPAPILLPMDWLIRKLGREVAQEEVRDILERLHFGVSEVAPRTFSVTVPGWRATKDVSIKEDLVEEVGRMVGYDSITPTPPRIAATVPPASEQRLFLREVRAMTAAQGFTEVSNYSFVNEEQMRAFGFRVEDHIAVTNPISSEQGFLRTSLLPGIRKNILDNSKHSDSFRLFEIGREIHQQPDGLPREIPHLAAAVFAKEDGDAGLFELKRLAECLMTGADVRPTQARAYEHPARAAEVMWRGSVAGRLFELHPSIVEGRAAVLDLDLAVVRSLRIREKRYRSIRRFPSSAFDLSVVAAIRELIGGIQKELAGLAGEYLESIEFVRQYSGPPLPEGKKSVSFRLRVGAPDRTLSADEIGAIRGGVIDGMRRLGYELRL